MEGISTVDSGLWGEMESPTVRGKMSKASSIEELSIDCPPTTGEKISG